VRKEEAMPSRKKQKPLEEVPSVRTTVVLPEPLWRAAKIRALEERRDLRDLIIEGLELVLAGKRGGR
jgi:hypothetical protein